MNRSKCDHVINKLHSTQCGHQAGSALRGLRVEDWLGFCFAAA